RKSANQGHAQAPFCVGLMYYHGDGVSQDYARAVEWYRKSANQGHAQAQQMLNTT
ncbi:MAG: sel1 repeat family protein, partial [Deltaproteobacteria bacterium]|nr:sel1 repeat family protein [Deltaproteobacteria bacterium]